MNLQLSDLILTDYTNFSFAMFLVALVSVALTFRAWVNGSSVFARSIFSGTALCLAFSMLFMGYHNVNQVKPYYDRFSAHYEVFEAEPDFWFHPQLQELADHGTVNGREIDTSSPDNEGVSVLAAHFQGERSNVSDPETIRALRDQVIRCVGANTSADYVRRLSELPLSFAEMESVRKEVRILFGDACPLKKDSQSSA